MRLSLTDRLCLRPDVVVTERGTGDGATGVRVGGLDVGVLGTDADARRCLPTVLAALRNGSSVGELHVSLDRLGVDASARDALLEQTLASGLAVRVPQHVPLSEGAWASLRSADAGELRDEVHSRRVALIGTAPFLPALAGCVEQTGIPVMRHTDLTELSAVRDPVGMPGLLITTLVGHRELVDLVRYCVVVRLAALPVLVDGFRLSLGPVFVPGATACPLCIRFWAGDDGDARPLAAPEAMLTCIGGLLAAMCVDYLSAPGFNRSLFERRVVDCQDLTIERQAVWRNSRCPACARRNREPMGSVVHA